MVFIPLYKLTNIQRHSHAKNMSYMNSNYFKTEPAFEEAHKLEVLPAKPVSYYATAETTNHSPNGEDRYSNGPYQILLAALNVPVVSFLPTVTDEVLNYRLWGIDHPSVVAKLEHAKDSSEDGVTQEAR